MKNKKEIKETSFTSTANTAPYVMPIGEPLKRDWWTQRKKHKTKRQDKK
jgi:hypothetical protein